MKTYFINCTVNDREHLHRDNALFSTDKITKEGMFSEFIHTFYGEATRAKHKTDCFDLKGGQFVRISNFREVPDEDAEVLRRYL